MNTTETRFWAKVDVGHPLGCWIWTSTLDRYGYGKFFSGGATLKAHRVAYQFLLGPIPGGLDIDHRCRVRNCVNPDHLEPVTRRENALRSPISIVAINSSKTHCSQGHRYTPENTYIYEADSYTQRNCRACNRAAARRYQARRRQEVSA